MDQLIFASHSHNHYWEEVGMLRVPVNIGFGVSWFFCFLVRVRDSGVTGGDGGGVPLCGVICEGHELGFSTVGIV